MKSISQSVLDFFPLVLFLKDRIIIYILGGPGRVKIDFFLFSNWLVQILSLGFQTLTGVLESWTTLEKSEIDIVDFIIRSSVLFKYLQVAGFLINMLSFMRYTFSSLAYDILVFSDRMNIYNLDLSVIFFLSVFWKYILIFKMFLFCSFFVGVWILGKKNVCQLLFLNKVSHNL